ncbi:MAG: preprotein translocase subunit SecY [Patescibacteria group bacterium]
MNTFKRIFRDEALRTKMFYVLGLLAIFRIAAAVPIPVIDRLRFAGALGGNSLLGLFNLFTGGGLEQVSLMMLGVGPYITASIIMQLLTMIFPTLKELYHEEGEAGRRKFMQYSRILTVPLAMLQGYGLLRLLASQGVIALASGLSLELLTVLVVVTAGSVWLMWLGEQITQYGIGNGISLLIFSGIVAGIPQIAYQNYVTFSREMIPTLVGFIIAAIVVIAGVVLVTEAERPIPISYAKRVRGMKLYGGVSTYLPLRVNQAGVIPIIFAISILLFPQLILTLLASTGGVWVSTAAATFNGWMQNQWIYGALYFVLVFLFTYFYTAVTFDSGSIATNLQKSGGFIPGMRPGRPTAEYLGAVINRITLAGGLFLGIIAIMPLIIQGVLGTSTLTIGGTALLIVVSVVLETVKQIQAQLTVREYE